MLSEDQIQQINFAVLRVTRGSCFVRSAEESGILGEHRTMSLSPDASMRTEFILAASEERAVSV
jgi:hypothetical protein